jgi:hypothetical protein
MHDCFSQSELKRKEKFNELYSIVIKKSLPIGM